MPVRKPKEAPPAPNAIGVDAKTMNALTGSADVDFARMALNQVLLSLWSASSSDEDQQALARGAFAALRGIAPADELEGMLAAQMVATHSSAMECLRRAMLREQTYEGRELALKHAGKLLAIYARQVEALDKHRGKGQQKITVEHVSVHAGGQAIVGNVETGSSQAAPGQAAALPHQPAELAPDLSLSAEFVAEKVGK